MIVDALAVAKHISCPLKPENSFRSIDREKFVCQRTSASETFSIAHTGTQQSHVCRKQSYMTPSSHAQIVENRRPIVPKNVGVSGLTEALRQQTQQMEALAAARDVFRHLFARKGRSDVSSPLCKNAPPVSHLPTLPEGLSQADLMAFRQCRLASAHSSAVSQPNLPPQPSLTGFGQHLTQTTNRGQVRLRACRQQAQHQHNSSRNPPHHSMLTQNSLPQHW